MILYGAGGHSRVIYDCLLSQGISIKAVFDDSRDKRFFAHLNVIHAYDHTVFPESKIIIGIGSNEVRKTLSEKISHGFGTAVHTSAVASPSALIREGSVVFHLSVVQAESRIGRHCILNTCCSVDHDCTIDDFVHIAPGARICGNVEIGEGTLIGAGAVVLPGIKIGKWCTIGAGAVVTKDVKDGELKKGIPAKKI